ncbi:MAG: phosphatidylglycerophosphatase A [Gammaproteobacteria bacterium]|nr:phosphatidylglycerophosphatase A [Gammaproteobacteria bacterium]
MADHKNTARAALHPLNFPTLALSVGGLGFLRPAPGTWGSLPPVVAAAFMLWRGYGFDVIAAATAGLLVIASAVCVSWGVYAESRFGRKDAAEVVADETAGVCLPVVAAVLVVDSENERLIALVAALVLFRLFDIAKPWPMRRLEQLPHGWGVLLDDLMAGVYAAVIIMATAGVWLAA